MQRFSLETRVDVIPSKARGFAEEVINTLGFLPCPTMCGPLTSHSLIPAKMQLFVPAPAQIFPEWTPTFNQGNLLLAPPVLEVLLTRNRIPNVRIGFDRDQFGGVSRCRVGLVLSNAVFDVARHPDVSGPRGTGHDVDEILTRHAR